MAIDLDVHGNTQPLEAAVQAAVNRIRRTPIKITVDDRGATQPLGNMKRGADEFTKSMEAANARILAFGASMAIINGVADSFKAMVRNMVEVEKAMADINVVMGLSAQNLEKFGDGLFKVAKETGAAFNIAAAAATEYARQGLAVEESLKRTRDALILTRLTGMDSAEAVKSLTAAMNTYGHQIKDTTQLVSKFAAVDVQFAVSAEDFAQAISRTGAAAKDAGVDIDELIGIVTAAQQQTARGGAVIGNSLKTIFTRVGRTDTLNQLEDLGIAVRDLEGNTLGAKRILTDLANTFDKLSEAQKAQIAQTVGGVFQINILKAILGDAAKQNGILAKATQISAGATDEAIDKNEQLRNTMAAMATETGLALKQLSSQIGEIMLAPGMEKVLNAVKSFSEGVSGMLGDGESIGGKFASGFLKGVGNIITGPGLVAIIAVLGKLMGQAFKFTKESLGSLIGVTSEAQKQKAIQTSLVTLFGQNAALNKEMLRTDISRTEKEKIILGLLQAQTVEANKLNAISKQLASTLYTRGYGPNLTAGRGKAYGHIPNFAHPEREQAAKGGYAAGTIRSMNMPGEGSVIYNSAETVKNFAGFKQPAIMPPQSSKAGKNYQQAFGNIHGFDPYAATGYIPNYAIASSYQRKAILADTLRIWGKGNARFTDRSIQDNLISAGYSTYGTWPQKPKVSKSDPSLTSDLHKFFGVKSYDDFIALKESKKKQAQLNKAAKLSPAAMLVPPEGYGGPTSRYDPRGKASKIWPVYALKMKPGDKRPDQNLEENIETSLNKVGTSYANSIGKLLGDKNEISNAQFVQRLDKGSEGAYGAAVGAVFEGAVNAALKYSAEKSDETQGDFDVRGGAKIAKVRKLFDGFPAAMNLADYKNNSTSTGNRKSFYKKLVKEQGAAYGFIPNFADPLSDAIGREKAAGVPVSQIRVGSHGALMSKGNPLGLGVTNTYDEPNGLRDVFGANGFVPNYAVGDVFKPGDFGSMEQEKANKLAKEANRHLEKRIQSYKQGNRTLQQLRKSTENISRNYQLGSQAQDNVNKRLNQSITTIDRLNNARGRASRSLGLRNANQRFSNTAAGRALSGTGGQMGLMMGLPMAGGFLQDSIGGATGAGIGGALSGAGTGASLGMMFGPLGTAIGAAVGGLYGLVSGLSDAEKAAKEKAKAEMDNAKTMGTSLASVFSQFPEIKQNLKNFREQYNKIEGLRAEEAGKFKTVVVRGRGYVSKEKIKDPEAQAKAKGYTQVMSNMVEFEFSKALKQLPKGYKFTAAGAKEGETFTGTGEEYVKELEKVSSATRKTAMYESFVKAQLAEEAKLTEAKKEQARAVIIQLNLQKAIIASQKKAAETQLNIKEKYLNQSNILKIQEKLMGGLMTEQQKAQLNYNKAINKAAEAFENAEATANATLKSGILQQIGSSETLQQELKKALSAKGEGAALVQDISDKVAGMSANELIAKLKEIQNQNQGNADIQKAINLLMETELQKRTNAVGLAQRQKEIAEGQASSELKINQILADRKQILADQERMNRMSVESIRSSQKIRGIDARVASAERLAGIGPGYQTREQQEAFQIGEKRFAMEEKIKTLEENRKIKLLNQAKEADKYKLEETQLEMYRNRYQLGALDEKEEEDYLALLKTHGERSKKLEEIEQKTKNINTETEKEIAAEKELLAIEEKRLRAKRLHETGPGAFGRGMQDSFKSMREQAQYMDYQLGEKIPFAFADGMANAMTEAINGTKDLKDALTDAASNFLQMIQQAMMQKMAYQVVGALGFSEGGNVRNYSLGGGVPARVSNGEYVMSRDAVNKYGGSFMHSLNAGGRIPGYSNGGPTVGDFFKNPKSMSVGDFFGRPMPSQNNSAAIRRAINSGSSPRFNFGQQIGSSQGNFMGRAPSKSVFEAINPAGEGFMSKIFEMLFSPFKAFGSFLGIPGFNEGGEVGSALAANFGGARAHRSGRKYQSKAMSSRFYAGQTQTIGLQEDSQKIQEILSKEDQARREAAQKAAEKKAKRRGLITSLLSTVAMGVASKALGNLNLFGSSGAEILAEKGIPPGSVDYLVKNNPGMSRVHAEMLLSNAKNGLPGVNLNHYIPAGSPYGAGDLLGPPRYYGGSIRKYASGGYISGKSGIDQIPAMLSEGEYVIRASSARQIGKPMLDRINAGKFNEGGAVTQIDGSSETSSAGAGNTNNINISINLERGSSSGKETSEAGSSSNNPVDSSKDQEKHARMAEKIKQQVIAVIVEEQRPGGILSE